ncbi:hypothetical protein BRYFOR_05286 [Marvinbryantia formatexigens DSM 14469]|uniref:Uncharacterized protein n=1 Tax=Marvinbryantia formatexigens DSM 14469 TaxID=478749 RepID=C6L9J6_9FIRM|nr:hypothetical protein BRYFOR_05286 [Marvinbryantia formatexigens DSM 14469]
MHGKTGAALAGGLWSAWLTPEEQCRRRVTGQERLYEGRK